MRKKILVSLLVIVGVTAVLVFLLPIAIDVYSSLKAYNARIAKSSDYTKITTPLSRETAADLCKKFEIDMDDKRCQVDAVVYGPNFFDDLKSYFRGVPENEATFELVQSKLGSYLVNCGQPDNEGYYTCTYDIRGDGIYRIGIFFSSEDKYYRVIANTGGS